MDKEIKKSRTSESIMFKDPKEYEQLNEEERKDLTYKMLKNHRKMFNFPKGGK